MTDRDIFYFFDERFGPVEHTIVLERKDYMDRFINYGFVTFKSSVTAKEVLGTSDRSKLTLASGRVLAVGPARRRRETHTSVPHWSWR